jgi:Na+-driven multidrug efflux pump
LREYVCIVAVFALAGLCIGLLLVWFGPFVGDIASGGVIVIGRDLMVAFAVLILVQSIHFPGGMFLTDVSGLRAQAVMSAVMLLINLPLSVLLARSLGAVGPVLGSAIAMVVAVLVPTAVLVVRRVDRVGSIQRSVVAGL